MERRPRAPWSSSSCTVHDSYRQGERRLELSLKGQTTARLSIVPTQVVGRYPCGYVVGIIMVAHESRGYLGSRLNEAFQIYGHQVYCSMDGWICL